MPKYGVPAASAPDSRGESFEDDPLLDDWLGDEAEIDWFSEAPGTTGQGVAERGGQGRRYGPGSGDDLDGPAAETSRIVRRRRAAALLVLLAVVAVAAVSLGVLGGSKGSSTQPTTPVTTTTTRASTTTKKPATATPRASAQPAAAPAIVLPAAGTLRTGDTGAAVKKLQQALSKLGFDPGAADGIFGPITVHAVAAFQEARGLANDGIVGPKTAEKINAGLAGQSTG